MSIKQLAVVGAGSMGAGIAQAAAQAGYDVLLCDVEQGFVDRGMAVIKGTMERAVSKGKLGAEEAQLIQNRIKGTIDLNDLAAADMVVEAIIENIEIKKKLFRELDSICKQETILASNTSSLSVTEMAAATKRPEQVIGMHFFNPVPVMKLVELIKGADTSNEVFQVACQVVQAMDKEFILVHEAPLFAVNRILVPMLNEAMFVLLEGTASAQDIDKGMCLGANHPIGPLALADLIGLDTLMLVMDSLYKETADSKYRPCPILRQKVRGGHLGRKSGRGFYVYDGIKN